MTLEEHMEALPELAALHKWANGWKVGYRTVFIVRSVYCEHRIEDRERWVDSSFQIHSAPTPLEALERFAEWRGRFLAAFAGRYRVSEKEFEAFDRQEALNMIKQEKETK